MYIVAWNVNGYSDKIHSYLDKLLIKDEPDIVFLSETKKNSKDLSNLFFVNYNVIINSHDPWRYHGVMMLVNKKHTYKTIDINLNITCRSDSKSTNAADGRIIAINVNTINIVGTYTPNSGGYSDKIKFAYRTETWDVSFKTFLTSLEGPTMWIGDINVAPTKLDLSNYQAMSKKAGGTIEEMNNLQTLLESGDYIDIWRYQHPDTKQYTWIGKHYNPHYGMRLDNIIITQDLIPRVIQTDIVTTVTLSDHLPISINLCI